MLPSDPRWMQRMYEQYQIYTPDQLRNDSARRAYAHSFPEKQAWLDEVADRLEASSFTRLEDAALEQASPILAR